MDSFTAFIIAVCVAAGIGFVGGRYSPQEDVKTSCYLKGEVVINNTVIKCKPVAAIVDGKRVEFVEK